MPKSQTRKSTLPILAPDHYELMNRYSKEQTKMIIKVNQDGKNGKIIILK